MVPEKFPPLMTAFPSSYTAHVAVSKVPSSMTRLADDPVLRTAEPLADVAPRKVPFSTVSVPLLLMAP